MISVVIPSYNRKDCILRLLADVHAQEGVEFEVIVVDDCSPDDTVEAIRSDFPQVRLLVNEVNGGPCVSRNRGVAVAKGEIIVGFDSDVSVPDQLILSKVSEHFDRSAETTGLAFRIFEPDAVTDDEPRWWHPVPIEKGRDCSFETDYFSGTAYAFRKKEMVESGGYPEILYMHYEEVELAYRLIDRGGCIRYCPDLSVVHHANPVSRRSEIKVFYKPRNQVLLAARCYPLLRGMVYLTPRLANGIFQGLRHGAFRDWVRAMGSAFELMPRCLEDRDALSSQTWRRMEKMKYQLDGSATPELAAGRERSVANPIVK